MTAFDRLYIYRPRRWLVGILVAYAIGGCLFAVRTPAWQAPDEPAHYNYVAHIARGYGLPVLRMGDYDQKHLEWLLAKRFVPMGGTKALRYEFYQPPLYYLAATPVYWLSGGNLIALRLFGVAIGLGALVLLYLCLELVFPGKTLIVLGATAFAALLPMHMAMTAAVNNDGLAELLLLGAMLVLLQWMREQLAGPPAMNVPGDGWRERLRRHQCLWLLGLLLGLGMLTKIYAYVIAPIALLTVVGLLWLRPQADETADDARSWRIARGSLRNAWSLALWTVTPMIVLALPFLIRNALVYGTWDLLGLTWHDQVVVGQPRTNDWIAANGWVAYGERAFGFTFRSFWGVFGWMGVFMDERIYTALLLFSGVIFLGVLWSMVRFISGEPDADMDLLQMSVLGLFLVILIAVTASYLWYNVKFVQHQGRYFFWGLLPIGTVVALGWREVLQPLQGVITGALAAVMAGAMLVTGYVTGGMDKWALLSIGLIALFLLTQPLLLAGVSERGFRWLPHWARAWMARPPVAHSLAALRAVAWVLPFVLMFVLDLLIPGWFILPQLQG
jgi:hypothetical protein